MKKIIHLIILIFFAMNLLNAQGTNQYTQTIRGKVVDADTKNPLPGAKVILLNTKPLLGANCDKSGKFRIEKVPIGRYDVQASFIGYKPSIMPEISVGSGKEIVLNIELKESVVKMEEVVVSPTIEKSQAQNSMSTVSARSFNVEESRRYAGSADDPLRAVSSFAGVAGSSDVNRNDIVVRGNSPKGLLWRLEGIDIPNPNHFARIGGSGGGITIFSSQVLSNSDFYTAAFSAEYGNALAGVFDMKFRNGNSENREYTFQAGIQGIDLAAEGPFEKGKQSTYLFNYRYSTIGLIGKIVPGLEGKLPTYQDLSFKVNLPSNDWGNFTVIGISGIAFSKFDPEKDSTKWKTKEDREWGGLNSKMGTIGLIHTIVLDEKTYLNSTISASGSNIYFYQGNMRTNYSIDSTDEADYTSAKLSLSSYINHKFSAGHTNKTGFIINKRYFDINIKSKNQFSEIFEPFVNDKGSTYDFEAFTESKFDINDNFLINAGLNFEYFGLNQNKSIEPRLALKYSINPSHSISLGYGMHSQMEDIGIYLAQNKGANETFQPNKNLGFSKAHHFVLGYDFNISESMRLKIEPYFQYLFDIPVMNNSYYSMLNSIDGYFNDSLVNKGIGTNYGIDLTLEHFLSDGYYYLLTTSIFQSKYKGGDGIERNTRFNSIYVVNLLFGKEFYVTENNILSINLKANFSGGLWYIPIDLQKSIAAKQEILDYANSYNKQLPGFYYISLTVNYRINREKLSHIISLQLINLLNQQPVYEYRYDDLRQRIEERFPLGILPFLSYKIEF